MRLRRGYSAAALRLEGAEARLFGIIDAVRRRRARLEGAGAAYQPILLLSSEWNLYIPVSYDILPNTIHLFSPFSTAHWVYLR